MCVEVLVRHGDSETICATVGELATALKLKPIEVSPDSEEYCLCRARFDELKAREAVDGDLGWPFTGYVIEQ
jgi:hypothetical protein